MRVEPADEYCVTALAGKETGLLAEFGRKEDLAREFRVSDRTIERWVRLRLLPAPIRLGRTSLYHLPTVKKYLAVQMKQRSRRNPRRSR